MIKVLQVRQVLKWKESRDNCDTLWFIQVIEPAFWFLFSLKLCNFTADIIDMVVITCVN